MRVKDPSDTAIWRSIGALVSSPVAGGGRRSAEEIALRIEEFIIKREIAEGARLPSERDLAQLLATSRPTVSQAIRILVVRGLVESRRGSGAYVTRRPETSLAASVNLMLSLNQESVAQLNDLRLWLETTGIREAIRHGTRDEIDAGERALQQLLDSVGDTAAWMSADTRFHAVLVRASHNPFLASIFESVHATLIDYEYRSWVEHGAVPDWLRPSEALAVTALHEPILRAVVSRDDEAGRIAVLRHHDAMAQHLKASRAPHRRGRVRAARTQRPGDVGATSASR